MSDQCPLFSDQEGVVTGYMCLTGFVEDLGNDHRGVAIYPSQETLKERKHCATSCGIVQVAVKIVGEQTDTPDAKYGFMDFVSVFFELGGASQGCHVYPSQVSCKKHQAYGSNYGGVFMVEVKKISIVLEPKEEKGMSPEAARLRFFANERWESNVNKTALAVELATRLRDHLRAWLVKSGLTPDCIASNAPPTGQPGHLLQLLDRIEKYAVEEHWADSKLHRYIGAVQDSMIWLGAATVHDLKEIMFQAKKHFSEKPDKELTDHNDPDSPFELDIGGEGG